MPASHTVDPSRSLVHSRAWEVLTDSDVREHYRRLLADPLFDPSFNQLADLREVERVEVSTAMIREAGLMKVFRPEARRAFVVSTPLLEAMTRMYGSFSRVVQGGEVRVFHWLDEAESWLGIEGS
jgi:hypothetical protein